MTLVVREIGRVILSFSSQSHTRDLGGDFGWSLVGAHEEGGSVGPGVAAGRSLKLVVESAEADQVILLRLGKSKVYQWLLVLSHVFSRPDSSSFGMKIAFVATYNGFSRCSQGMRHASATNVGHFGG